MNKNIVDIISDLENMKYIGETSAEQICAAESELELKFAEDYIEYVNIANSLAEYIESVM